MDRISANILTRELRSIYKSVDDLGRRLAASHITGKVAEIDGNRVRLQLQEKGAGGKPFLSPWVQLQEAAGATGTRMPVKVGDPMRLFSPHGELGPQSLAIRDGYTDSAQSPAKGQEMAIAFGGCALRMEGGLITLEGKVEVKGAQLTHNGVNVGDDHKHKGVEPGGGLTDVPV